MQTFLKKNDATAMRKKKTVYTWDDIEQIRAILKQLKHCPPPSKKTSNRAKIASLKNEIRELRLRGWSWEEIKLLLRNNNILISIVKLKEYTELKNFSTQPTELTTTARLVEEYRHSGSKEFMQLLSGLKKSELIAYVKALSSDFPDNKLKRLRKYDLVNLVLSNVKGLCKPKDEAIER